MAGTDPEQVAIELEDHLSIPDMKVKVNPALGLVATAGWFWIEGYDGKPLTLQRSIDIPATGSSNTAGTPDSGAGSSQEATTHTVSVKVTPEQYTWNFGDGTTITSKSLGKPYPQQSDVTHTYEYSSLKSDSGFPIKFTVKFSASYTVNGGAAQTLPPITRSYTANYRVQEAQAILASH